MDTLQTKLSFQHQDISSIIDWLEIYDAFTSSNLSQRQFYKILFPKLIKEVTPNGCIPSLSTFKEHIYKIKKSGREEYALAAGDRANNKEWKNKKETSQLSAGLTKTVNVATLDKKQISSVLHKDDKCNSLVLSSESKTKITIKLSNSSSIEFDSTTPEYSVALLIKNIGGL